MASKFESIWLRVSKSIGSKSPTYTLTYPFTRAVSLEKKTSLRFSTGRTNWFVFTRPLLREADLNLIRSMRWNDEMPWCAVVLSKRSVFQYPVIHPYGFVSSEPNVIDLELFGAMNDEAWYGPSPSGPEPMR